MTQKHTMTRLHSIADEVTALATQVRSKRIAQAALADRLYDIGKSLTNEVEQLEERS